MIVGFSITRMNAEKLGKNQGNLNINYRSDITDVEAADIPALDEQVARISYELGIDYVNDDEQVAGMDFEGTVLWRNDAADLVEQWDDSEDLEQDVAAAVTNHVVRKCLTHAVGLTDALDLPAPVPMPRVNQ